MRLSGSRKRCWPASTTWTHCAPGLSSSSRCVSANGGYRGGCPLGTLASELAENDTDARDDLAAGYRRWHPQSAPAWPPWRTAASSYPAPISTGWRSALLTTLQGGLLLTKTLRDPEPLETALNTMIDHIESFTDRKNRDEAEFATEL